MDGRGHLGVSINPRGYKKMAVVSDEARIRELAEAIRSKCAQAQQMKQQTSSTSVSTGNMQVLSM